jgi:hypothetical protein
VKLTIQELTDLCRGMSNMAPGYMYATQTVVGIEQSPASVLSAVVADAPAGLFRGTQNWLRSAIFLSAFSPSSPRLCGDYYPSAQNWLRSVSFPPCLPRCSPCLRAEGKPRPKPASEP